MIIQYIKICDYDLFLRLLYFAWEFGDPIGKVNRIKKNKIIKASNLPESFWEINYFTTKVLALHDFLIQDSSTKKGENSYQN